MNHFVGLLLLAICISLVFAGISKDSMRDRIRYFLVLMAYMAVGSLVASWVMAAIP